jgi:putative transposase
MLIKDEPGIEALRDYSAQYPRYGTERVRIFLRRVGIVLGRDREARI